MSCASGAAVASVVAVNGEIMATTTQAYLESKPVQEAKALITELCRQFYQLGWVSGTGGSITIKVHDDSIAKPQQLIIMSPSGPPSLSNWLYYSITTGSVFD